MAGILIERIGSAGTTRIVLRLGFDETERAATIGLHQRWRQSPLPPAVLRSVPDTVADLPQISVVLEDVTIRCDEGLEALALCLGRYFIRTILRSQPALGQSFRDVGDVFWFDQNRNLLSVAMETPGIEGLRQYLSAWYATKHTSVPRLGRVDYLRDIEDRFAMLFPGAKFVGVEPRPGLSSASVADSYFLIERNGTIYDLAEMSSGEQAVFPLLFDLVRLEVARSLVLIDELELHLHPPQQQALLSNLRKIGPGCQFAMTTHSLYLEAVMPDDDEIRLEGGPQCSSASAGLEPRSPRRGYRCLTRMGGAAEAASRRVA